MIEDRHGNLLEADTEALVNTVNTVGVMGKGIALQFKQAFPENFRAYERAFRAGQVQPGHMFVVPTNKLNNPKYIINFPTKRHWKDKSKIEDIEAGLVDLIDAIKRLDIRTIAVPPLGCGNGGLDWLTVKPLITAAFDVLPQVHVLLFAPNGTPAVDNMPVATQKPPLTRSRALLLRLLELYAIPGYRLSLLEIQKLAYFLQVAGEPLKLRYAKQKYGPYAENLNHVLQRLEGHYIRGYGDRSRQAEIRLLPEAIEEATRFLENEALANERLERVSHLIQGYETPYGMELLATVHWVAKEEPLAQTDVDIALTQVQSWSQRKQDTFKVEHIRKAWHRLHDGDWLDRLVHDELHAQRI